MTEQDSSLYERIGGEKAIDSMVVSCYERVLQDPELAPFFLDTPIDKLRHMQKEFFSSALGGPIRYTGRPVLHAHQGLGITRHHFQRFAEHLLDTLGGFPLSDQDRYDIIARVNTYQDDVVIGSTGVGA